MRRNGKPRTEKERIARHKRLHPNTPVPKKRGYKYRGINWLD